MTELILVSLTSIFTPELLVATLVLALMSSAVVIGLYAYRSRSAPGGTHQLWTIGWMLFLVYLAAMLGGHAAPAWIVLVSLRDAAVGVSGLFLLAGTQQLRQPTRSRRELGLATALVILLSYTAHVLQSEAVVTLVLFALVGGAAIQIAVHHWRHRRDNRGAQMLALGHFVWGVQVALLPAMGGWASLLVLGHFVLAMAALVIAMGVIIDQEVAASEEKYRAVFDAGADASFMVDLFSLAVLDANQAAYRLTKHGAGELTGASFPDVCPSLRQKPSNQLDHRAMFNAVFRPESEFHLLRTDGDLVLCEGETNLVRWRQRLVLQIKVRRVGERQKLLQLMRRAEKMSSLGKLIAGVAHELNNPLAVVMGYAQLLIKQRSLDETTRHELRRILHESERASKIVGDLLSFARPSEPQLVAVDLNRLVDNVLEVRAADCAERGITLVRGLAASLPRTQADPFQIEQVVTNLLSNAIHALANHPGPRRLTVATAEEAGLIRITVTDTGPGIAAGLQAKVFEPFFTTKGPGKGTGLGLPISKSIAEEHHGRLRVESETGAGASFVLELPVVAGAVETVALDHPAPGSEGGVDDPAEPGDGVQRVLLVDDEPGILEVLELTLVASGYRVETATNGLEAWQRIEGGRIDLVISDLAMPELGGEELYARVKAGQPRLARRFLFLTGNTLSPDARVYLEGCGARWFSKPFNLRDIEEAVHGLLRPAPLEAILSTANPPQ